jgi:hypothetical protein
MTDADIFRDIRNPRRTPSTSSGMVPPSKSRATMRIEIVEIRNRGVYDAWHNGELICDQTRTPFLSAARVLLQRGADPNEMLEKVRCGSDQVDMRAPIGVAAKLTVKESDNAPRFRTFQPFTGIPTPAG